MIKKICFAAILYMISPANKSYGQYHYGNPTERNLPYSHGLNTTGGYYSRGSSNHNSGFFYGGVRFDLDYAPNYPYRAYYYSPYQNNYRSSNFYYQNKPKTHK